ncbi:MAG TPA: prepilin peptidase [Candidatus Paceibacterota bacterium]|nr:prepilin peptidase [Verrucomicrobiota bacterium]HRY48852.1 prepilin peptidase [Candidatus Paceibacterota bacterium]HSA03112.1 prepilin peptidase [Candidatus Paceibacterota bacterium]
MFEPEVWRAVPFHFWSAVFFVFGSIVGSFLNVCIHRLPRGESVVHPPSHCPHCGYAIPWYLNIPLVTWVWLRGRCAHCSASISIRYWVVELATALLFLAAWLKAGEGSAGLALVYSLFLAGLLAASVIDYEHFIIPDEITLGGMVAGFLLSAMLPGLHQTPSIPEALKQSGLGILAGTGLIYATVRIGKWFLGKKRHDLPPDSKVIFGENGVQLPDETIAYEDIFYRPSDALEFHARSVLLGEQSFENVAVRLTPSVLEVGEQKYNPSEITHMEVVTDSLIIPREAMGLGDVKFMGAIGAFLGWQGVLFSLICSAFLGALGGGLTMLYHRLRHQPASTLIQYGPYIAMAAAIWLFWGPELMDWWFRLMTPRGLAPFR